MLLQIRSMKKITYALLILQVVVLSACGNDKIASLMLPDRSDVTLVSISGSDINMTITDDSKIDDLFTELSSVNNKSGESYNDTPETDDYLKIVFSVSGGISSNIVYVFKKEGGFFIEQPYHGIFSIDEAQYNAIRDKI